MNNTSKIKILKKINVTDLSGEKVMVDFEQGKYFMIRGAGNEIWDLLEDNIVVSEIVEKLLKEFDVERDVCEKEVVDFLTQLEGFGIIAGE